MAQSQQPKPSLEDQLRNMIISSSTLQTNSPQTTGHYHNGPHQPDPNHASYHVQSAQHMSDRPFNYSRPSHRYPRQQDHRGFHQGHQDRPAQGHHMHGPPSHGPPSHGPPSHGPPSHGPSAHSSPARGPPAHGPPAHGPPGHRPEVDPSAYQRGPSRGYALNRQPRQLYQPHSHPFAVPSGPEFDAQSEYLQTLASQVVSQVEMTVGEVASKDQFRIRLQDICQSLKKTKQLHGDGLPDVTLNSFGSLSSGFATSGSDMDLAIVTHNDGAREEQFSLHEDGLPRALEKELLDQGIGARLLTRTRVPIIKICENPPDQLLTALLEERQRWETLPDEEKYSSSNEPASKTDSNTATAEVDKIAGLTATPQVTSSVPSNPEPNVAPVKIIEIKDAQASEATSGPQQNDTSTNKQRRDRPWTRERVAGPLDFPKQGVGIQCDINFFNPLGLYNTKLLRCYSKCDPRVRPMVLFVKSWAKRRKINSSYSGTLSSYGYVLMVLHYLLNVASPPVLPNLQLLAARTSIPPLTVDGWEVCFYNDEGEIENSASRGLLTQNREPLGVLLRGFFQYFASTSGGQGFIWMQDVLSLRTPGGIMKKEEKGWTGAKTEVGDNQKEVRHRYLFAIEDPFEHAHNVARTVTHNGIVAIRDEFRRSWRIIQAVGRGLSPRDGELFADVEEGPEQNLPSSSKANVSQAPKNEMTPLPKPAQPQVYTEAFPSLGAARPPPQKAAPTTRSTTAMPPAHARFPRHQNGNLKSKANEKHTGAIDGEKAMAHLREFNKKKQQVSGSGDSTPTVIGTK